MAFIDVGDIAAQLYMLLFMVHPCNQSEYKNDLERSFQILHLIIIAMQIMYIYQAKGGAMCRWRVN